MRNSMPQVVPLLFLLLCSCGKTVPMVNVSPRSSSSSTASEITALSAQHTYRLEFLNVYADPALDIDTDSGLPTEQKITLSLNSATNRNLNYSFIGRNVSLNISNYTVDGHLVSLSVYKDGVLIDSKTFMAADGSYSYSD